MLTEETKKLRTTGIGGSDIGAIMGLSKFKTPYEVYLDKIGEGTFNGNNATHWGDILEDVVAREYSAQTGNKIQRVNQTIRSVDYDFALANIDRAVVNPEIAGRVFLRKDGTLSTDRILECKTANGFATKMWGEAGSDYVPDSYFCQVQWYMMVTGAKFSDLAVLIGGQDYRIYHINRDEEFVGKMIDAGQKFWNDLKNGIAPDPSTTAEASRYYGMSEKGSSIELASSFDTSCSRLDEIAQQIKDLKAEEDRIKTSIMVAMGDAETATRNGVKVATWKTQTSNRLDSKTLKAEQPDIYQMYVKQSESRVFRLA